MLCCNACAVFFVCVCVQMCVYVCVCARAHAAQTARHVDARSISGGSIACGAAAPSSTRFSTGSRTSRRTRTPRTRRPSRSSATLFRTRWDSSARLRRLRRDEVSQTHARLQEVRSVCMRCRSVAAAEPCTVVRSNARSSKQRLGKYEAVTTCMSYFCKLE